MLLALDELRREGLQFTVAYSRLPFFLRPGEEVVAGFLRNGGLPRDATRGEAFPKLFGPQVIPRMNELFDRAGLNAYWGSLFSDTMDSHRLAWYAKTESAEKGELFWKATSRRYFEGKDTAIQSIRLDDHQMLMECAEEAGLDLEKAKNVLNSDMYQEQIWDVVRQMQAVGVNSIPVLIFEVDGLAAGSWLQPASPEAMRTGRAIHHGSGSVEEFCNIFKQLHDDCPVASM